MFVSYRNVKRRFVNLCIVANQMKQPLIATAMSIIQF